MGKKWFGEFLGTYPSTDGAVGAGTVPWLAMGLMMGGVVTARFGLWLYDLVISQMLQVCLSALMRCAFFFWWGGLVPW